MNTTEPEEWFEIVSWDGKVIRQVQGPCNHLNVVPVESGGEIVAGLCLICDAQLPAGVA